MTVVERTEAAEGVVRLRLANADGEDGTALPAWEPGAHLDLVLPSGLVRQYSLCGDPAETTTYTVATRLDADGRGGSREVHEQLWEATDLEVRGPRNRFRMDEAPTYLFLAGGIGITPILPMLRAAEAAGTPWRLVYGGRSRASMPFLEEIGKLAGSDDRVTVVPQDEDGHPDLAAALREAPSEAAVYCCGPGPMLDAVSELCAGELPGGGLHMERFTSEGAGSAVPDGENRPFEVELRRSGTTVSVPADTTALAAIRTVRPQTESSCEEGWCGTCLTPVVEGTVDHRDELLTDGEREESMLICVSRAAGERLTLDL